LSAQRRADDAAFVMGVSAFSENYCDTGLGSVAHVNSIVVPALLLAAQQRAVTGREALAAVVVGYNVMEWVAASLNGGRPRMAHQIRGFRPTPTAGPLAAAAVLGRLAGLTAADLANAIGVAASQGSGLRAMAVSPTSAIMIQSGEALRRAVLSTQLAAAGLRAHPGILRCEGGFFPAYTFGEPGKYAVPTAAAATDLLSRVSMKLDCTPHTFTTMLDAARALARGRAVGPADVEQVIVRVPSQHNVISGDYAAAPADFSEASHHVPYCIALAMRTGSHLFPAVIEGGIHDGAVHALMERVKLEPDERLTRLFDDQPLSWPATVNVRWADGTCDEVAMIAPETADWNAADAVAHAARKVVALFGDRAGDEAGLVAEFSDAGSWDDLWQRIRDHPLTAMAGEASSAH
jgi:2-methylcitrate dehydratase PrpD